MNEPAIESRGSIRRFVGLAFIVVGALWMTAAGLCSGAFFVSLLVEGGDFREIVSIVPMILLVGGFGAGIGLVIFIVGRALRPKA